MSNRKLRPLNGNEFVLYTYVEKYAVGSKQTSLGVATTVDPNSVQEHTTGWKPVSAKEDPATFYAFSAFKATATAYILNKMKIVPKWTLPAVAAGGMASDSFSLEFNVIGKSVESREWYGEIGIALTMQGYRLAYVKYTGLGTPKRSLIEVVLAYRLVGPTGGQIIPLSENLVAPSMRMDDFLKKAAINPYPCYSVDYRRKSGSSKSNSSGQRADSSKLHQLAGFYKQTLNVEPVTKGIEGSDITSSLTMASQCLRSPSNMV